MKLLNKLERKLGRYALHNLTLYIIGAYIIGYLITLFAPELMYYLNLEPALILRGQVWRIVSWVLIPPESMDIFTIVMLLLYFSLGTSLERSWGAFRYNLYIFMGIIASVIGAFVLYLCGVKALDFAFSTFYINMSIFLAYAVCYPNDHLYLYFVIPIKIKWLAILDAVIMIYNAVNGNWAQRVVILSSMAGFILFLLMTRKAKSIAPKEIRRKQNFRNQVRSAEPAGVTKHKCAICGRTELDGDDLEFRFCSKCEGNYEYCQDHLFTHEHVRRS